MLLWYQVRLDGYGLSYCVATQQYVQEGGVFRNTPNDRERTQQWPLLCELSLHISYLVASLGRQGTTHTERS